MGNSKLPSDDSQARIKGLSYGNVKGTTRIPSRKKKKYVLVLDSSTDLGRFQEEYVFEIQLGFEVIVRCKYPGPTRLRKVTDGNSPLGHFPWAHPHDTFQCTRRPTKETPIILLLFRQ